LKDYYQILGSATNAAADDIKKAYRKLAIQYHPDKNPGNDLVAIHFKEINEAYTVLSHPAKRKKYDEERWLSGMSSRSKQQKAITPDWILTESKKLAEHMSRIDTYRMSHIALKEYVLLLLSDSHLAVLVHYNDRDTDRMIVQYLLKACSVLEYKSMLEIAPACIRLVGNDVNIVQLINEQLKQHRIQDLRRTYMPVLLVVVAILVCLMIYFSGRNLH